MVDYFQDLVIISENTTILKKIEYSTISKIFKKWEDRKDSIFKKVKKKNHEINSIKNKIKEFYIEKGFNVRIIYRTTQESFGKESPDNLLPKKALKNNITVFLNFKNHVITQNNIVEIFAFRDIDSTHFKLIKNPHLHKEKVDLELIDSKFKFKSIENLFHYWE